MVNILNDRDKNQSYLGHVVNEIKEVTKERELLCIHIGRLQNRNADRLAYMSRVELCTDLWLQEPPNTMISLMASECTTIPT